MLKEKCEVGLPVVTGIPNEITKNCIVLGLFWEKRKYLI